MAKNEITVFNPLINPLFLTYSQAANAQKWPICAFIYRTFLVLFSERHILEKSFLRRSPKI